MVQIEWSLTMDSPQKQFRILKGGLIHTGKYCQYLAIYLQSANRLIFLIEFGSDFVDPGKDMPWINIFNIMLLILDLYVVTLRVWACFRLHMIVTKNILGPQTAAAARAYVMMPRSAITIICVPCHR